MMLIDWLVIGLLAAAFIGMIAYDRSL